MARIPLLSGSRVPLVTVDDDALLLLPPPPLDPLRDVAAAVGEALRYPLSGPRLADLVTRGGRVAIVVEPRSLPLPGAPIDPRQQAVAAVIDELERLGMPAERHTILIAGGLERRAGRRELEGVLRPMQARATSAARSPSTTPRAPTCARSSSPARHPVRIHGSLLDADLVVCVTAAETSERGGACALLGACAAEDIASVGPAPSLLAPSLSPTGVLAGRIAAALARRDAVTGVSIVLDHPRLTGRYRGYPSSPRALAALARSPLRRLSTRSPGALRDVALQQLGRELTAGRGPRRAARRRHTPRRCCAGSRSAASRSPASSTRSSCRCRGSRCTSRASR